MVGGGVGRLSDRSPVAPADASSWADRGTEVAIVTRGGFLSVSSGPRGHVQTREGLRNRAGTTSWKGCTRAGGSAMSDCPRGVDSARGGGRRSDFLRHWGEASLSRHSLLHPCRTGRRGNALKEGEGGRGEGGAEIRGSRRSVKRRRETLVPPPRAPIRLHCITFSRMRRGKAERVNPTLVSRYPSRPGPILTSVGRAPWTSLNESGAFLTG